MIERSTVGSLLRSTQAFCGQLCEKETLDFGIAYSCAKYPKLADTNQFREVLIANPADIPLAFEQAEESFRSMGLQCFCWAPAGGSASVDLASFLTARGYKERRFAALLAVRWVDSASIPGVRILPARAMRAALEATFENGAETVDPVRRRDLAAAAIERMDDPQYELFVALVNGKPAGRAALYQVGDIARVMDLTVLPDFVDQSVERALFNQVLVLAKRLAMRNICAQVDASDARMLGWFHAAGFVEDGSIVEFDRQT